MNTYKKISLIFCLAICIGNIIFPIREIPEINTTLVLIDEQENNSLIKENAPFSDGIYEALWTNDKYIFFDMKLKEPIKLSSNHLDEAPYINIAVQAGADSILLVKVNYDYINNGKNFSIKIDKIFYKIYSINYNKIFKTGNKNISINEYVKNDAEKEKILKKLGFDILNEIFDK